MKKIYDYKWLLLAVMFMASSATLNNNDRLFEISKNIEIFVKAYKKLNKDYVDDIDPSELMKIGIDAMVESLDPYTNYISEAQVESYRLSDDERYQGIGAKIEMVDGKITVTEPYDGSPALKAGVKAGDEIIMVNGLSTEGKNVDDLDRVVRGVAGTSLNMQIKRAVSGEVKDIEIVRSSIARKTVPYYGMVRDGVGYVILTTFMGDASASIRKAIRELEEEHGELSGLILDLRNNGGGLLREAIAVSNIFVPKGEEIVSTRGKIIQNDRSYKATAKPLKLDLPLAVLINKSSASASEIVSGVMQDLDRGVLIGQRSFGKGLVQNTTPLAYNNQLKVTTAKYYIPSGRCIQSVEYENGEPVNIDDSLRSKFRTNNGRTVLDGGGVAPDIKMDVKKETPLIKSLKEQHMIFKFVNQYITKMDSIKELETYEFDDFDQFTRFLESSAFTYTTESEKTMKSLQEKLQDDFSNESLIDGLQSLEKSILREKSASLKIEKDAVVQEIETEIVSRFFQQSGRVQFSLSKDPEVSRAVEILKDEEKYRQILNE